MSEDKMNKITQEEWRCLGFYYEQDDTSWLFVGSKHGLRNFSVILREYALKPKHNKILEHDHYGPYWYLKLSTWDKPAITKDAIYGRIEDFLDLSRIIEEKLSGGQKQFIIDKEYSLDNELVLLFDVRNDGFDPSSTDPLLCKLK